MPIDITATDVAALAAALADLQAQIDVASGEVTALTERADAINVNRFDRRVTALEENVDGISSPNLRRRITALEETSARLERTIDRFRERIIALETASAARHTRGPRPSRPSFRGDSRKSAVRQPGTWRAPSSSSSRVAMEGNQGSEGLPRRRSATSGDPHVR